MKKQRIGAHIRMRFSLQELVERADSLELPFFQCFFVPQESGRLIRVAREDIYAFIKIHRERFKNLFCHVSYWVNLASLGNNGFAQLRREITFAKRLEITQFVLHAGSAKGALAKMQGIDALSKALNNLFACEQDVVVLLENSCHGNLAVGSDITDFKYVLEKIDKPEKLMFCIDTAHAYSFGYDLASINEQEKFIDMLQATIGIERIKLIHLNDTVERLGSRIDRHSVIGQGRIGEDALKHFAQHPKLEHIPLLLELPELSVEEELSVLDKIREW